MSCDLYKVSFLFKEEQNNFNVKLHMNTKYFGETLEGTGQAEDYRLKLSPKKASQQYGVL